jgi:hypothetical protein
MPSETRVIIFMISNIPLSPKRRGHTFILHHRTPAHFTSNQFLVCAHCRHTTRPLAALIYPQKPKSTHYATKTYIDKPNFKGPDSCLPLLTHTHTCQQWDNFIHHSQCMYTWEHELLVHLDAQNFHSLDPSQLLTVSLF